MNESRPSRAARSAEAVIGHYSRPSLLDAVEQAVAATGKSPDTVTAADLAPADEFHIGGRPATAHLFDQLGFAASAHVLDVGCGIGGPARFASDRVRRVTGIDLTADYVATGKAINRWLGLEDVIELRIANALATGFPDASFDGGYMLHVGMNIEDKAALFAEVARVLRPGTLFGVYDVMRLSDGDPTYPVPWASEPDTSHLVEPERYREAAFAAGFTIVGEQDRSEQANEFFDRLAAAGAAAEGSGQASGPPPLGLHLVMGPTVGAKVANMVAGVRAGLIAPVELILRRA